MEGDARDQLQPQPRIAGEVAGAPVFRSRRVPHPTVFRVRVFVLRIAQVCADHRLCVVCICEADSDEPENQQNQRKQGEN
jgi:hypothetical protein